MAKLKNINNIINELKENNYLREFINLTFNCEISNDNEVEIGVQEIEDNNILFIYQIGKYNKIEFYDFFMKDNNVYLDKLINRNIIINYVYINKCIDLYLTNTYVNNFIRFIVSFYLDNKKKILLEYLPEYIVNIIIKY